MPQRPRSPYTRFALFGLALLLAATFVATFVATAQGHDSLAPGHHNSTNSPTQPSVAPAIHQDSNSAPNVSNSFAGGHPSPSREHFSSLTSPLPSSRAGLQLGLRGRWWDDHKTVKKLHLRSDQQQHMDTIFEANKPALINLLFNLQQEQARLASLPPRDPQNETRVFAAIDRISQARADLEKQNLHMLLQLRSQLDPQQVAALDQQIAKTTHQPNY